MAQDKRDGPSGDENADDEAVAKSRRRLWIWLAVAGVLLMVVSIGGTLTVIRMSAPAEDPATDPAVAATVRKPAIYYPMKPPIIVNFSVRGRQRFLQAELTLLLRDGAVISAVELHQPMLRNALILLYGGQDYEQLQTAEGKELLRQATLQELQRLLQKEIGQPGIEQVLFTNFVMQ